MTLPEEIGSPGLDDSTARLERVANKALGPAIEIGKRFQEQFQREFGSHQLTFEEAVEQYKMVRDDAELQAALITKDAETVGIGRAVQRHRAWVRAMERKFK